MRILKPTVPFPTPIKLKVKTIGPLGSCFRSLPPGIKHFQDFNVISVCKFETPSTVSYTSKMEIKTIGPPSVSPPQSPSGGQDFKKADYRM